MKKDICNEIPKWLKMIIACWLYVFAAGQVAVIQIDDDILDSATVLSIYIIFMCVGVYVLGKVMLAVGRLISQESLRKKISAIHLNNLLARDILRLFVLNDSNRLLKYFYYSSFGTYAISSIIVLVAN